MYYNLYRVPGGGGAKQFLCGEAPPQGPNPYPLYTILTDKVPLLVYLLLPNGPPFTYLPISGFFIPTSIVVNVFKM